MKIQDLFAFMTVLKLEFDTKQVCIVLRRVVYENFIMRTRAAAGF